MNRSSMQTRKRLSIWVCALGIFYVHPVAAKSLVSPWDNLSPAYAEAEIGCRQFKPPSPNLETKGFYTDKLHSKIDPSRYRKYQDDIKELRSIALVLSNAADKFVIDGSRRDAVCAAKMLSGLANAGTLTGKLEGDQAHLVQTWMLASYSVSWLKLRASGIVERGDREKIESWIDELGSQVREFFDAKLKNGSLQNNLRNWAALASLAQGIVVDDEEDYRWGIANFKLAVDDINHNFFFPEEVKRADSALAYHIFAMSPLVMLSELALANDEDLYSYKDCKLVKTGIRIIRSIADPSDLESSSGFAQKIPDPERTRISWFAPFEARFAGQFELNITRRYQLRHSVYLGGDMVFTREAKKLGSKSTCESTTVRK